MNTPVTFPIAKLLKENKYNEPSCNWYISKENTLHLNPLEWINSELHEDNYSAPTIAEVVMWFYEKHGIWIGVELVDNTKEFYFQPTICTSKDRDYHDEDMINQAKYICKWNEWQYNSPKEAYLEAIAHILKNKSYENKTM